MKPCPTNYRQGCICYSGALEPADDCYVHGLPDVGVCPYCGQFRGLKACKRCGCVFGLPESMPYLEPAGMPGLTESPFHGDRGEVRA